MPAQEHNPVMPRDMSRSTEGTGLAGIQGLSDDILVE